MTALRYISFLSISAIVFLTMVVAAKTPEHWNESMDEGNPVKYSLWTAGCFGVDAGIQRSYKKPAHMVWRCWIFPHHSRSVYSDISTYPLEGFTYGFNYIVSERWFTQHFGMMGGRASCTSYEVHPGFSRCFPPDFAVICHGALLLQCPHQCGPSDIPFRAIYIAKIGEKKRGRNNHAHQHQAN